jgi:hypothetical protein
MESQAVFATEADMADDRAPEEESPPIINWGGTKGSLGGYGMGGGAEAYSAPGIGMGGGGAAGAAPQTPILPEADTVAEPAPVQEEMGEALSGDSYTPDSAPETMQAAPEEPEENLILGIRPVDEQGQILAETPSENIRESLPTGDEPTISMAWVNFPWRMVEIALAAVALLTGLMAFFSKKRH